MRKGIENREEWLNTLKSSMEVYSPTPPEQGWERLSVAMIKRKTQKGRLRFISTISAVAAVALLFLLLPFAKQEESTVQGGIAVVDNWGDSLVENVRERKENERDIVEDEVDKNDVVENDVIERDVVDNDVIENDVIERDVVDNEMARNNEDEVEKYEKEEVMSNIPVVKEGENMIEDNEKKDRDTKSRNIKDRDTKSKEVDAGKSRGLTWEEYIAAENDLKERGKKGKKLKNLLALQVGNGSASGFKTSGLSLGRDSYAASDNSLGFTNNPGVSNSTSTQTLVNIEERSGKLNSVQTLPLYNLPEPELIEGVRGLTREYNHKQPITFSLMVGKELSKRFTLESGLSYSLLRSDLYIPEKDKTFKQQLHYIGLPLKFNWNFVNRAKFLAYAGAGAILEKSIYARLGSVKLDINRLNVAGTLGAGAQYRLSKNFGIYLEPSMVYYFGMGDSDALSIRPSGLTIKSIRSEYPLGFMLNGGFRFSF